MFTEKEMKLHRSRESTLLKLAHNREPNELFDFWRKKRNDFIHRSYGLEE